MFLKFKIFLSYFFLLLFLYLFINLEAILWDYLDPDGFLGLLWFYLISAITLVLFFLLLHYGEMVIMLRRKEKTTLGSLIMIGLLFLFGSIIYFGPTVIIARSLKDRYKYIERSEKYFSEGKFDDAVVYAEKVYRKANETSSNPPMLVLSHFIEKSDFWIETKQINWYQASINYAYCLQASGKDIEKSEEIFLQCEKFAKEKFQDKPEFLVVPVMGLAKIAMAKGDITSIESYYMELSRLLNNLDKKDVSNTVQTLLFYAMYFNEVGDFEQASKFKQQALTVYEQSEKSKSSLDYLFLLLTVANDFLKGDLSTAEKILNKAAVIANKNKDNQLYVNYLITNTKLLELRGMLKESEEVLLEVIKQTKERQGEQHLFYAQSVASLASFYYKHGQISRSSQYFNHALGVFKSDTTSTNYYSILLGSACADFSQYRYASAKRKIDIIEKFLIYQTNQRFGLFTEEEKETYISVIEKQLNLINKIYISLNDSGFNSRLYNNILAIKSIALQSNQHLKQQIKKSNDEDLRSSYDRLLKDKEYLTKLRTSGVINESLFVKAQESIRFSEKKLLDKLAHTSKFERFKINAFTVENVSKALENDQVAIEFINVPISLSNTTNVMYYALVLKPNSTYPIVVPLFEEKAVAQLLQQKGTTEERIRKIYSDSTSKLLYNYIWKPLKTYVSGSTKIFISLSGILNQISFPALTINENSDIVFLSSTRNLVKSYDDTNESHRPLATLFGGINYNGFTKDSVTPKNGQRDLFNEPLLQDVLRSEIRPLPETKTEVERIAKILSRKSYDTIVFTGSSATKATFKNLENNQPKILHIATHGFYYPPDQSFYSNDFFSNSTENGSLYQDPLFRSGLVLARVNVVKGNNKVDNGILTAFEISKIDLANVDLVVLSACETGLGDIKGGEGVYGLQRAFRLAGVKSIVMSLWKVSDSVTSELMQEFYSQYLSGSRLSKQEALKAAQRKIRKIHPEPFYWAAFVIIE